MKKRNMQILIQGTISLAKYSIEDIQYVLIKAIQGLLKLLYTKKISLQRDKTSSLVTPIGEQETSFDSQGFGDVL